MSRVPLEAKATQPLTPGSCDWCGGETPEGRTYCNSDCRVKYNNLTARQGKSVMQDLKHWRKHRGGKGTPGEGKLTDIAERVDAILREDRERKAAFARSR